MRTKSQRIFLLCLMLILSCSLWAGGGFTKVGYNARSVAMGGAFLTQSGTPYSLFYNPASISDIKSLALSSTYIRLFPNIDDDNLNYYTLSAALPLQSVGVFGIGATMFNANFWNENIIYGTYSRDVFQNFSVGGSIKLLRWSATAAPGESALSFLGFTADAGARYLIQDIFPGNDIALGVSIRNITQPSIAKNGSNDAKLPMGIDLGVAYISNIYNYSIAASLEIEDEEQKLHVGAEILAAKGRVFNNEFMLNFRAGGESIVSPGRQGQLNGGLGISYGNFSLDYAYVHHFEMISVDGNHIISLSYSF